MKYSIRQDQFQFVKEVQTERSVFDRSFDHKTTLNSDKLVPFFIEEALPGDSINLSVSWFLRMLAPLGVPIFDNLYFDVFFFFCPLRLIWSNAQRFFGERDPNPDSSIDYVMPKIRFTSSHEPGIHSISDYFGCPIGWTIQQGNVEWNALPYRAYKLTKNQWFRRQDIQDSIAVPTGDGPDIVGTTYEDVVETRLKRRDYFTSCLSDPQKGDAVELPLGTSAPVIGNGKALMLSDGNYRRAMMGDDDPDASKLAFSTSVTLQNIGTPLTAATGIPANAFGLSTLSDYSCAIADLSEAVGPLVNELRECIAVQRFREREMRAGSRYIEIVYSMFHVRSDDARLQRVEYLGGFSEPIHITPVAQTAPPATQPYTDVGTLRAFAVGGNSNHGFSHSFVEHGYVLGICNIRSEVTYQGGLPKMFSRNTRFDWPWPVFAHLGEQPVLQKELCWTTTDAGALFGFQEQYADRRYKNSMVTGQFRSVLTHTLENWHLSQDFNWTQPTLSEEFLLANTPMQRIKAFDDETSPDWALDAWFKFKHAQVLPMHGDPGYMDHF